MPAGERELCNAARHKGHRIAARSKAHQHLCSAWALQGQKGSIFKAREFYAAAKAAQDMIEVAFFAACVDDQE